MTDTDYFSLLNEEELERVAKFCDDETLKNLGRTCKRLHAICEAEKEMRPEQPRWKAEMEFCEWMGGLKETKASLIVVGPPGSGKTTLIDTYARLMGVKNEPKDSVHEESDPGYPLLTICQSRVLGFDVKVKIWGLFSFFYLGSFLFSFFVLNRHPFE